MTIMDDNYMIGPPHITFESNQILTEELEWVILELQPRKLKCCIATAHMNEEWDRIKGDTPNKTIFDGFGIEHYGISICNIPMGSDNYIHTYLEQKKTTILKEFNLIVEALNPG